MGINNRARKLLESNSAHDLEETKKAFLLLATMYAQMGKYLNLTAKGLATSVLVDQSAPDALKLTLGQYHEMGEQMKSVGMGLDALGGAPVLKPGPEPSGGNGEQKD
jgi:hypothetical protein